MDVRRWRRRRREIRRRWSRRTEGRRAARRLERTRSSWALPSSSVTTRWKRRAASPPDALRRSRGGSRSEARRSLLRASVRRFRCRTVASRESRSPSERASRRTSGGAPFVRRLSEASRTSESRASPASFESRSRPSSRLRSAARSPFGRLRRRTRTSMRARRSSRCSSWTTPGGGRVAPAARVSKRRRWSDRTWARRRKSGRETLALRPAFRLLTSRAALLAAPAMPRPPLSGRSPVGPLRAVAGPRSGRRGGPPSGSGSRSPSRTRTSWSSNRTPS